VLSYSVSSRTHEIGVRLALGADASRVVGLVVGQGLRLAVAGAAIGLAASVAVARLMQGLILDAAAWDARLLGIAAAIVLATAALAAFVPARRASEVDPMVVLRME
jgi:putative ABC transport system permease protein